MTAQASPAGTADRNAIITDSTIRIPLPSGDTITLASVRDAGDQAIEYVYRGHVAGLGFHLVRVQYYETSGFLLIHDSTGRQLKLRDEPVFSPSGREMVVAHHAWTTESGRSRVQVLSAHGDSLLTEYLWEQEIEYGWGPKEASWRTPDTIDVIKEVPTGYRQEVREIPAYLARVNGTWVAYGIPSPDDTTTTHSRSTP